MTDAQTLGETDGHTDAYQGPTYLVNEIYYTIQGEGRRWGIPHVFVRFAQCNLPCNFCDTEFESYTEMTAPEILAEAQLLTQQLNPKPKKTVPGAMDRKTHLETTPCKNVMFCGGEPLLQLNSHLIGMFKANGWYLAIETNGTREIPEGIDWVACSPKVAEHAIVPTHVQELKYVRDYKQGIPRPACTADHYLISPIFEGNNLDQRTLE